VVVGGGRWWLVVVVVVRGGRWWSVVVGGGQWLSVVVGFIFFHFSVLPLFADVNFFIFFPQPFSGHIPPTPPGGMKCKI